ncbi:phosphonate ABC transporter, permease protein PhnE [Rubellimicrobium sp. CFH 75288]|uniref:phosphonate ABC transporter, permease protein PhnE n=1 Tax=Rubellimicrobium sp. CFH 75288 TaxID=2697034 RepID=UPI001412D3A9|nr:phosphonate ABC transporter, permease protein PhnE [Rubellimicrobium sp. CFH 75288]NAZ36493.1 phosphonate ABC transporter, permease protein PhnE [Rubellimicrobium sp. CFH 75288]
MTALSAAAGADLEGRVLRGFRRRRLVALSVPVLLLLYLAYVFVAFDVMGLSQRARLDNAAILVRDSWSHKVHVTQDLRNAAVSVSIEGNRRSTYREGAWPGWVRPLPDGGTLVELPDGHAVTFAADGAIRFAIPDWGVLEARVVEGEVVTNLPDPPPSWANASPSRLAVTLPAGRLTVTAGRAEVFRYFPGWEMFFFHIDSPYHGRPAAEILWGGRIDPARPNLAGAWRDFWTNPIWRHADVAWAIWETVLMAFLGTVGAAAVALPLAFAAARGVNPLGPVRFLVRRVFDFVRGVDALIWTIALSRAFGPGPLTGTLAILVTDSGTFGKLFSEALENMDRKQVEGVASTGASPAMQWRWGVIPQVFPVLASQVLYLFESNVRSSTIIGAIVGGGIGLLLTQAIQTQGDWEKVTYYIVLIVVMVFALDAASGWLRARIIHGAPDRAARPRRPAA